MGPFVNGLVNSLVLRTSTFASCFGSFIVLSFVIADATKGKDVYNVMHGPNGTRNGALDKDHAYNGTHNKLYYRTPMEFYTSGASVGRDRADTARGWLTHSIRGTDILVQYWF